MQNGMVGVVWLQITISAIHGQWRRRWRGGGGEQRVCNRFRPHWHPLRPGRCYSSSQRWGRCHHHPLCWYETWVLLLVLVAQSQALLGAFRSVVFVDDSGRWGNGGLFTALEMRSDEPRKQYDLAGKMNGTTSYHLYYRAPVEPTNVPTWHFFQIWILGMSCSSPLMTNSPDRMAKIM